jgi:hypothetical protein
MLLDPVRDQIEDLGRELQLGAWFSGLRWLRANPHPMVDVLLEGRVPKHYVKEVLGHANISTTSTYLAGTADGLDEVMARFEREREARESRTTNQPASGIVTNAKARHTEQSA